MVNAAIINLTNCKRQITEDGQPLPSSRRQITKKHVRLNVLLMHTAAYIKRLGPTVRFVSVWFTIVK